MPLIVIGALEATLGLFQNSIHAESVSGTYPSRDHFAGLLEMLLPFAIMYSVALLTRGDEDAVPSGSIIKGWCLIGVSCGIFLAIIFSLSRMGFISTLGSLFLMGVFLVGPRFSGKKRWAALGGLAAFIVFLFVFLPSTALIQRFGALGPDETFKVGRWPIWKDTLHLIAAYPLFGTGMHNFYPGLLKFQTSGLTHSWVEAHNDYLQLLAELGIAGFLLPATMVIAVYTRAVQTTLFCPAKEQRWVGLACIGGLTAILIHSLADFNMYIPANALVLWWIAGIAAGLPVLGLPKPLKNFIAKPWFAGKAAFALAIILTFNAAAWLIFVHYFDTDLQTESLLCRFGFCDTANRQILQELSQGGPSVDAPRPELVELLRRDPAAPNRWCDLAEAMQRTGETGIARYCFSQALALGPKLPFTLFKVARFYLGLGERSKGLELMSQAMVADPVYQPAAFTAYTQRKTPLDEILRHGLPDGTSGREYLRYLITQKRDDDAQKTWNWIASHGYSDHNLIQYYIKYLTGQKKLQTAVEAWAQYTSARDPSYLKTNFVFNGDFESDPVPSPFDWMIAPPAGVAIDFDTTAHSGARSLRIRFDGTQNVSDTGVYQSIFLKPGRYRLRAYVRAQDISTDEGIYFSMWAPNFSLATEAVLGSQGWKVVEHSFAIVPGTGLVEVRLSRKPSLKFDNLIRGTLWVDQVRISPESMKSTAKVQITAHTGGAGRGQFNPIGMRPPV